jgi:hypothetical protein
MLPILRRRASNWNLPKHESASNQLSLDSSPPISSCSSEPTRDLPHLAERRLPRSIGVSRLPRVSGEIYTHPRARTHTHTHTHTYTRIPPPIYRRVRGFSLPEGWGSFDLLSGRAKSGISMKSAVGISTSNLSPSTYLCERICVQICIGCPVFSLPEFGSSWFFLQGNHRRDAPLPREFATPFNSSLWLCDWATPRVYFTFLLDEVRWAESDGLGYHNSV